MFTNDEDLQACARSADYFIKDISKVAKIEKMEWDERAWEERSGC